jgi:hypothetical protein
VLQLGNSHMARWLPTCDGARRALRAKCNWESKFVVLNVCRFTAAERQYKGVDKYVEAKQEMWFAHPESGDKFVFVLVGKAEQEDVDEMEAVGLTVFSNVSDAFMSELYAASDLYMNFSKWEGYNLGIG